MRNKSAWFEKSFVQRMKSLKRINLLNLYPSESWALNYLIDNNKTFLDLGCGDGNKYQVCKKLNSKIIFKGIDYNNDLIDLAKKKYKKNSKSADFECDDIENFLINNKKKYDVVMAWAFLYTLPNYIEIIDKVLKKLTKKYFVFDLRISNIPKDIIDVNKSFTFYDRKRKNKSVYVITSYKKILEYFKKKFRGKISNIYISAYYFPPSKHVILKKSIKEPAVCTFIIKKGKSKKIQIDSKVPF